MFFFTSRTLSVTLPLSAQKPTASRRSRRRRWRPGSGRTAAPRLSSPRSRRTRTRISRTSSSRTPSRSPSPWTTVAGPSSAGMHERKKNNDHSQKNIFNAEKYLGTWCCRSIFWRCTRCQTAGSLSTATGQYYCCPADVHAMFDEVQEWRLQSILD